MSAKSDNPNHVGGFSIKEISIIIAVISITITMIAATSLIVIVGLNLDWTEEKNQVVGLDLMNQVGVMFTAIGHSSILLIGMGAGTGAVAVGMAIANGRSKGDTPK